MIADIGVSHDPHRLKMVDLVLVHRISIEPIFPFPLLYFKMFVNKKELCLFCETLYRCVISTNITAKISYSCLYVKISQFVNWLLKSDFPGSKDWTGRTDKFH